MIYHTRESKRESSLIKVVYIDQEKDRVRSLGNTRNHTTDTGVTVLQWTRWVEHYGELLDLHFLTKLSVLKCRGILTTHHSSYLTVRRTLLSMLAITSRWCRCIVRMMDLCARCFLPVSGLLFWGGLMGWRRDQSTASRSLFKSLGLDLLLVVRYPNQCIVVHEDGGVRNSLKLC